jgi:hypothetical protein
MIGVKDYSVHFWYAPGYKNHDINLALINQIDDSILIRKMSGLSFHIVNHDSICIEMNNISEK